MDTILNNFFEKKHPRAVFEVRYGKELYAGCFSYQLNESEIWTFIMKLQKLNLHKDVKSSQYTLYFHNDIVYNIFNDGSSFCFKKQLIRYNDFEKYRFCLYDYRQLRNDAFPSLMNYPNIEKKDAIIFTYNDGTTAEIIQNPNESFELKIVGKDKDMVRTLIGNL